MKWRIRLLPIAVLVLAFSLVAASGFYPEDLGADNQFEIGQWNGVEIRYVPGEAIITPKLGLGKHEFENLLTQRNLTEIREVKYGRSTGVIFTNKRNTLQQIKTLNASNAFGCVEPNMVGELLGDSGTREVLYFSPHDNQWHLHNIGQDPPGGTTDADIDLFPSYYWSRIGDTKIVFFDSGMTLEDDEIVHPAFSDDTARYILAYDYIDDPAPFEDVVGHGTFMTGTAASNWDPEQEGDWVSLSGNYYGRGNHDVIIYKITNDDETVVQNTYKDAVYHALDTYGQHRLVLNTSIAWPTTSTALLNAMDEAHQYGEIVCAGAGNSNLSWLYWPARYSGTYDNIIAVGGTDADDHRFYIDRDPPRQDRGSHYGINMTVVAPGEEVFSTTPGYPCSLWNNNNDYAWADGTSIATAQVSGLAALIWDINPQMTYGQVINTIIEGAEKVHNNEQDPSTGLYYDYGQDGHCNLTGYGRINVYNSAQLVPMTGLSTQLVEHEEELRESVFGNPPQPLAPPQNWDVRLTWDKHYGRAVDRYRVDRSDDPETGWSLLRYQDEDDWEDTSELDTMVSAGETYYYRVIAVDSELNEEYEFSNIASITIPEGGGGDPESAEVSIVPLPNELTLDQNYPNPFNPDTQIKFGLPASSHVRLKIMNIRGQTIRTLIDDEKSAGWHTVMWDGRNEGGNQVASGIYLYLLEVGGKHILMRMTLIR